MKNSFRPFVAGVVFGNVFIMNHVYENELLKQSIRDEIADLKRIRDFVSLIKEFIVAFHNFY